MNYSLPESSVLGILQARILEWVTNPFSRGYSRPRNWTQVSCISGKFFTTEPPGESSIKYIIYMYNMYYVYMYYVYYVYTYNWRCAEIFAN